MSKKSSIRLLVVLLSAVFATAALVVADVGALAQNANSSGAQDTGTNANTSMTHHRSSRGRRRGRRRAPSAAAAASSEASMAANTGGEQTDLSGTYTGTIDCLGNTGDATLTINGQQFTLSGASNASGRIVAETTRGYTGATLRFDSSGGTPQIVSVRARHNGSRLSLEPVPGEANKCSFRPSGGGGGGHRGGRRRGRRGMPPPPAATGETAPTEAAPAAPAASGESTGTSTGTRTRRGRRRSRSTNANSTMNSNSTPPM